MNINDGVLMGVRRIGLRVRDLVVDGGIPGAPLGYRLRGATQSGAPTTGTWKTGDEVPDRTGIIWICTAGGTPGTWAQSGLLPSNNLSDLGSASTARTNLGLGSAAVIAAPVSIGNGGTGQTTQQAAINALTGTQSAGKVLRSDGTNATIAAIQAGDVPTLNQNTSGTAAGLSSTLAVGSGGTGQVTAAAALNALGGAAVAGDIGNTSASPQVISTHLSSALPVNQGGTGQVTAASAYNALSPMTTTGDLEYESGAATAARLAGPTSATKQFLTSTGTGSAAQAPAWGTIAAADLPAGTTSVQGALQLDGTASDIQPLGAQAAGATGKPSDAGHVHAQIPLSTQPSDVGYQAWNFDPLFTTLSVTFSSLPIAGDRYLARIDVHAPAAITAIWALWIKPSGGSPANNFLALYNSAGTQVGSTTSDFTATSNGLQGFSLGGSQNLAIGTYYVAYLCGTQGGTPGGLAYSSQANGNIGVTNALVSGDSGNTAAKRRFAVNGTGASTLPGSFTLSSNGLGSLYPFWCALA